MPFLISCLLILTGCAPKEIFTITTLPDANICLPLDETPISVTDNMGKAKLAIPSKIYSSYITVQNPDYAYPVPMGLDIKKSYHGIWWKLSSGYIAIGAGSGVMFSGSDAAITAGACLVGVGFIEAMSLGLINFLYSDHIAYSHLFTYVNNQVLKIPQLSPVLLHPDQAKTVLEAPVSVKRKQAKSGSDTTKDEEYTTSKRSKADISKKISGVYKGSGKLLIGKTVDENYNDIVIKISQVDKNHVNMVIFESGEEFFDKPILFEVKNNNGAYSLINAKIPSIKVTITKKGVISFLHPKVNIDDVIYTLTCTAQK